MVRIGAMLGDQQGEFYADNRSMKYFEAILQHSPKIVSAYVGLNDGQFRQARRLDSEAVLFGKRCRPGTRFSYRWLEYPNGGGAVDHYVFLDANGQGLGAQEAPTAYDPRNRMWYRATVEASGLYITDPDVFATLGLIGFTVGAALHQGRRGARAWSPSTSRSTACRNISPSARSAPTR